MMNAAEDKLVINPEVDASINSSSQDGLGSYSLEVWSVISLVVITIILALYEKSSAFRYYLKFAIYVAGCSVIGLYLIPLSLLRPKDVRNIRWALPPVRLIPPLVGIRWKVTGAENLAKEFSCVVVANHQSMWDFMAICELWPTMKRCSIVAKRAIMYVFPFGLASWLCGTIFIDRSNAKQSRTKISAGAEQIQQNKTKMWIFPEGTRSKKPELLPFKKGAFHIAVQNKLPIVPVVISPYTFINDKKKIFNTGSVLINVMDPIPTDNVDDVTKLTEDVRELMNEEFLRLASLVTKEAGSEAVHEWAPASPKPFENGRRS